MTGSKSVDLCYSDGAVMTVSKQTLREVMAELGARGGQRNTPAQKAARVKNAEKARKAREAKRPAKS